MLVLFEYLTLVIGYMNENDYDKVSFAPRDEAAQGHLTERVIIKVEDEDTEKLEVHLEFKVELFKKPEDGGQAVLLFFLVEGDSYDLKSFLDIFKERIAYSFKKVDSKKLPGKV